MHGKSIRDINSRLLNAIAKETNIWKWRSHLGNIKVPIARSTDRGVNGVQQTLTCGNLVNI